MKINEAFEKIRKLYGRLDNLELKVHRYAATQAHEHAPLGEEQEQRIEEWIAQHEEILKQILELEISLQRTYLVVPISLKVSTDKEITCTIAQWRQLKKLAERSLGLWWGMGQGKGDNIYKHFDPATRQANVNFYNPQPRMITRLLERVNVSTDVVEKKLEVVWADEELK